MLRILLHNRHKKEKKIFHETQIDLLQQILIIFRNQLGRVLILRFHVRENNLKCSTEMYEIICRRNSSITKIGEGRFYQNEKC